MEVFIRSRTAGHQQPAADHQADRQDRKDGDEEFQDLRLVIRLPTSSSGPAPDFSASTRWLPLP